MEVSLCLGRVTTMLPVIMLWNGMMPPAGKTVLWTGSKWPLKRIFPLFSQVCQPVFKMYIPTIDSVLQNVTVLWDLSCFIHMVQPQCNI